MFRTSIRFLGVAALVAFGASDALAQVVRTAPTGRGWLGVSYAVTMIRTGGTVRETIVIQQVEGNSPAQRAGVEAGDTILAVNDIRATDALMRSLSSSLSPGDEVRLRVRREGREQERRVRAAEWPAGLAPSGIDRETAWVIDPDSLRGRVRIYLDSARRQIELMPRANLDAELRLRRAFPDSAFPWPRDSMRVWRSTPGGGNFTFVLPGDSLRVHTDSIWMRIDPQMRAFQFRMDSILRFSDTLRIRSRAFGPDGPWAVLADTVLFGPRGSFGIATFGERGVAGAELTEVNPGLGEYFGTDRGLLVVRVPEGTPAHRAGLMAGDVIVRAGGRDVRTVADLRTQVSASRNREPVPLEILRKRARQTIQLGRD